MPPSNARSADEARPQSGRSLRPSARPPSWRPGGPAPSSGAGPVAFADLDASPASGLVQRGARFDVGPLLGGPARGVGGDLAPLSAPRADLGDDVRKLFAVGGIGLRRLAVDVDEACAVCERRRRSDSSEQGGCKADGRPRPEKNGERGYKRPAEETPLKVSRALRHPCPYAGAVARELTHILRHSPPSHVNLRPFEEHRAALAVVIGTIGARCVAHLEHSQVLGVTILQRCVRKNLPAL